MRNLLPLPRPGLERGAYRAWAWAVAMPLLGLALVHLLSGEGPAPPDATSDGGPLVDAPDGTEPGSRNAPPTQSSGWPSRPATPGATQGTSQTGSGTTTTTSGTTSSATTTSTKLPDLPGTSEAVDGLCHLFGENCEGG